MKTGVAIKPVAAILAAAFLLTACDRTRETYRHYADTLSTDGKLRTERTPLDASFSNSRFSSLVEPRKILLPV